MLPNDPMMLLSIVNTRLRDRYESLESLCEDLDEDGECICCKLAELGYLYDKELNRFV